MFWRNEAEEGTEPLNFSLSLSPPLMVFGLNTDLFSSSFWVEYFAGFCGWILWVQDFVEQEDFKGMREMGCFGVARGRGRRNEFGRREMRKERNCRFFKHYNNALGSYSVTQSIATQCIG
jgi:hypothetical protein